MRETTVICNSCINISQIKKIPLDPYDAVVLVNPGEIDPDASRILASYLRAGGSLFMALGERSLYGDKNPPAGEQRAFWDLLPFRPADLKEARSIAVRPNPEIDNEEFAAFVRRSGRGRTA